ncbi:MAG: cell shape determination protein CcmA [Bacteroidetes bacterium 4572_112]|nr:MAG: cell shape determination protein CcmA [Bacteroidetes bacterium 4572_112]
MGRNSNNAVATEFNRIVAGTSIHGEIETKGDIRIDGTVVGTLNIHGKLVLGNSGKIEGEIKCKNAEVMGTIEGEINVSELLSLKESSSMKGDIITNKISIEPGAKISGTINMDKSQNETTKIGPTNVQEKQTVK